LAVYALLLAVAAGQAPLDRAEALERAGRPAEAASVLQKWAADEPNSAPAHTALGVLLLDRLRLPEARTHLERAIALDPRRPAAAEALARVCLLQGDAARAAELLRPLAAAPEADDTVRLLFAQALLARGDPAAAARALEVVVSAGTRARPEVYVLAARASLAAAEPQKAAEVCERGMAAWPLDEPIETVYLSLPAEVVAARLARRFDLVQQAPDPAELIALGRVLSDMDPGRKTAGPELAEKLLSQALALAPENPAAHFFYGQALARRASPDAAFAAWDKALSFARDDEMKLAILTRIARRRQSLGQWERAGAVYRDALAIDRRLHPPRPAPAFEYFQFLRARSRQAEAARLLHEILTWDPLYALARMELARQFAERRQWPEAIQDAELALRLSGDNPGLLRAAHTLLARAYAAAAQPDKAALHQAWVESH
jgi:tetratricopeptide (TPR) repeat protein